MDEEVRLELARNKGRIIAICAVCSTLAILKLHQVDRQRAYDAAKKMVSGQFLNSDMEDETLAVAEEYLPILLQIPPESR